MNSARTKTERIGKISGSAFSAVESSSLNLATYIPEIIKPIPPNTRIGNVNISLKDLKVVASADWYKLLIS
jgi:hypothetical protein